MMLNRRKNNTLRVSCEPLEDRVLFAWGAFPQLIDQDVAASTYSQYNGAGQTIAFIDTGFNYNNSLLSGKYLGGYDFISNDSNPIDEDGHPLCGSPFHHARILAENIACPYTVGGLPGIRTALISMGRSALTLERSEQARTSRSA